MSAAHLTREADKETRFLEDSLSRSGSREFKVYLRKNSAQYVLLREKTKGAQKKGKAEAHQKINA